MAVAAEGPQVLTLETLRFETHYRMMRGLLGGLRLLPRHGMHCIRRRALHGQTRPRLTLKCPCFLFVLAAANADGVLSMMLPSQHIPPAACNKAGASRSRDLVSGGWWNCTSTGLQRAPGKPLGAAEQTPTTETGLGDCTEDLLRVTRM